MDVGLEHVEVRYGRRLALSDLTLTAEPSLITAVVGGDGAGKTTAARAMVGAVPTSRGRVHRPERHALGYLPAGVGVYVDLTVRENISFVASAFGLSSEQTKLQADALLERTGLADVRERLAGALSGGMRRKLALLLVLMHEPRLLVLDEPTTGLDPISRSEVWRLIAAEAVRGAAVVFTTTYTEEAERAAQVVVLDAGRNAISGTPEQLIASIPGAIASSAEPAANGKVRSWRRGSEWRLWSPDGSLPPGASGAEADLEDAITVAAISPAARVAGVR